MSSLPRNRAGIPVPWRRGLAAHAQDEADPSEAARFRFGALRFTPSIAVSNLGVDNNVFNEADNPQAGHDCGSRPCRGPVAARGPVTPERQSCPGQYLYFNEYDNQRSWNSTERRPWEMPLTRMTPFATAA